MDKGKTVFAWVIFMLFSMALDAQTIITDRPGQNDSPMSVPKGAFQIETGALLETDDNTRNWVLNNTLFKYGITEHFEIRLLTDLTHTRSRPLPGINTIGIGDLVAGVKYNFFSGRTSFGYLGHVIFPSGTRELSRGDLGMNHHVALTHQFTDWLSLTYNAGVEYFFDQDPDGLSALSFGFALTDRIGFFTEIYTTWAGFESFDFSYDHGFTWLVSPHIQVDFSMGTGISSKSNYYAVGFSWLAPYPD